MIIRHISATIISKKNNILKNLISLDVKSRDTFISKVIDINNTERREQNSFKGKSHYQYFWMEIDLTFQQLLNFK